MLNRIKYTKPDEQGICESTGTLIATNGAKYKIRMDVINMTFEIINVTTYRKYCGGDNINNLHVLKRKIRQRLVELKVPLVKEVRDRNYGRCEKGQYKKNPKSSTDNGELSGAIPA